MIKKILVFLFCFFFIFTCKSTIYTVDLQTDGDDLSMVATAGTMTLRKAIRLSNSDNTQQNSINFAIPGAGLHTIDVGSGLTISGNNFGVIIDGFTQAGSLANTASIGSALLATYNIEIKSTSGVLQLLTINSNNNVIKGICFNDAGTTAFNLNQIDINVTGGTGNSIVGCYIGTSVDGTSTTNGTVDVGIAISGTASCTLGDGTPAGINLISSTGRNQPPTTDRGVGIYITSTAAQTIKGNVIGPKKDGTIYPGFPIDGTNATGQEYGIYINNSNNNIIGGSAASDRNIISANGKRGIYIEGTSTGNSILNNYIGIGFTGNGVANSNQDYGIYCATTGANTIGGSGASEGNVISGNTVAGINITLPGNGVCTVLQNTIGLASDGTPCSINQATGIAISNTAANVIGGISSLFWNIISGNSSYGINLSGAAAGNLIKGNRIGVNASGNGIAGSPQGIGIYCGSTGANTIGGSGASEGNVISGNFTGISIQTGVCTVYQNTIGLNSDGTPCTVNQTHGMLIATSANIIGGNTSLLWNIISGNSAEGISLSGAATSNLIIGNRIGVNAAGNGIVGAYQKVGILCSSTGANTIGGSGASEGNIISGNDGDGIIINGSGAQTILQNTIGLQADGTLCPVGQYLGIAIFNSANVIGGNNSSLWNIISGNTMEGILFMNASAGNSIIGNRIGVNAAGNGIVGSSQDYGINYASTAANTIGGSATATDGNIISGNVSAGIHITAGTGVCTVYQNIIGLNSDGTLCSVNQPTGINILNSAANVIGGNSSSFWNIITGNSSYGINLGGAATGNLIKGNRIGVNASGNGIVGSSQDYGIYCGSSGANTIGGSGASEGNVISGNGKGIQISGSGVITILQNIIGLQANGTLCPVNQWSGIFIGNTAANVIGGTTSSLWNIISGNNPVGIYLSGGATGNIIKGNRIGLNAAGNGIVGSNQQYGINCEPSAGANNTIGGSGASEGNVISGNTNTGIYLDPGSGVCTIYQNIIGLNSDGTLCSVNQPTGIAIVNIAANIIGGNNSSLWNIISGNTTQGISFTGAAAGSSIRGNRIGVSSAGNGIAGSSQDYGIVCASTGANTIGGSATATDGNIISGNTVAGINITANGACTVYQNTIGLHSDSTLCTVDQPTGIRIANIAANVIGGNNSSLWNIISGNTTQGILFSGTAAGSVIMGNRIGVSSAGNGIASSSQDYGISYSATGANIIGGSATATDGNIISGNTVAGINITANGACTAYQNTIGLHADGTLCTVDQPTGIAISNNAANVIGGNTNLLWNIISGNTTQGISFTGTAAGSSIRGNRIGVSSAGNGIAGSSQDYGISYSATGANTIGGSATATDGNIISGNITAGINITANGVCTVYQNTIGLHADGTLCTVDQPTGIAISNNAANVIGGNTNLLWNIISGNTTQGISFTGAAAGSSIRGNRIGVSSAGTGIAGSSQDYGISYSATGANTIGGSATATDGNIISGNITAGINITANGVCTVYQNTIGLHANGTLCTVDQPTGIAISNTAANVIGGNSSLFGNIISGNIDQGIYLSGAAAGNLIKGNRIGVTAGAAGNGVVGSHQDYGISCASTGANTIGGSGASEGNVISGNTLAGINITGNGVYTVYQNIIGLRPNGTTCFPFQPTGIRIANTAANVIGGNTNLLWNIISGNTTEGILLTGASTGNVIKGNRIGVNSAGDGVAGTNQIYGIHISSSGSNTIGGTATDEGNVISGNFAIIVSGAGIYIDGTGANTIYQNIIGLQADGTTACSQKQLYGIVISNATGGNVIGGSNATYRNVISGNAVLGVFLGSSTTNNVIKGNFIGPTKTGLAFVATSAQDYGVWIDGSASGNTIGGTNAGEGNVISGNYDVSLSAGVFSTSTGGNNVFGNTIGLATGGLALLTGDMGQTYGVQFWPSYNNIVGGSTANHRNIISGNTDEGVSIMDVSTSNVVKGNYIGVGFDGNGVTGSNQDYGVNCGSTGANTIGGTTLGDGNTISGNITAGVSIGGTGINTFYQNTIGLKADKLTTCSVNQRTGIAITNNGGQIIGGLTTLANSQNIISGNTSEGIYLGGATTGNLIKGNLIGPNTSLATVGTQPYGIRINGASANSNVIGGKEGAVGLNPARNIISFNSTDGVYLDAASTNNIIARNLMYSNGNLAINLNGLGNAFATHITPTVTSITATSAGGTATANDSVEVFASTTGCQNAHRYLGTVQASAGNTWTITGVTINSGDRVTATARIGSANTSQLSSSCFGALPIELLDFTAVPDDNQRVLLKWITASETNNDFFTIERSANAIDFQPVLTVDGAGNSTSVISYQDVDNNPFTGISYYRLKQTDFDGKYEYSQVIAVSFDSFSNNTNHYSLFPNPITKDQIPKLAIYPSSSGEILVVLQDVLGNLLYAKVIIVEKGVNQVVAIDPEKKLASGIYLITATSDNDIYNQKLIIED